MAEDNSVLVVAVLAVIASLAAAGFSYYSAVSLGPKIAGYATGEVNLTVETAAIINFTDALIDWGSGRVNTGETSATLDTDAGTVTDGNWTAEDSGLILDNIGNTNVSLNLDVGKTAAAFIGGTSPTYKWQINDAEAGSCVNATGPEGGWGAYATASTEDPEICSIFDYTTSKNSVNIDIQLVVPYNSNKGGLTDTITATAAAV